MDGPAVAFARGFFEQHKPAAVICHGSWDRAIEEISEGEHAGQVA